MKLTWPQAFVAGLVIAALVVVTVTDKDQSGVILIGGALLAGLGLIAGKTDQVAKQTNGNTAALLDMISRQTEILSDMAHRMAEMQPPTTPALDDDLITVATVRPVSPAR